ncbi:MAG: cobalamin B12-binding domain-containing protein [Dehalococcoidia bacterium]|nr:MAG: methylmalonyl-CoA mutase [bacterium]MCE7929167.1 methylmalonyl-CoA mutase [Chloroflexi bacterium CFX7]MCK6564051.1 cobalamin-dependent protein [Dehalococcoidia bacterium]NUQ55812.1 cobalamin B12-binding domain-containing protein [Dehalococcoidia bacterium]RIL03299.1 MAG: methylmalonyl-CoA mutase [bacterium]
MKRVKVLIAILGLDQHEVGAVAVARILRDAGMEVIYAGRFNLPTGVVKTAIDEDVDVIGISCHSWEYLYYADELMELLRKEQAEVPVVVGGSVVTPGDARELKEKGIAAAFGPASRPEEMVQSIRELAAARAAT